MTNFISAAFVVVFFSTIGSKILAAPSGAEGNDDGTITLLIDPEEYENMGEDFWPTVLTKRASFWSPHPSDYNPMRRPGQMPRNFNFKRDIPYHPYPRIITMKQSRSKGFTDEFPENGQLNAFLGGERQKKARAASVLLRFGGTIGGYPSIRRKPGQKYVPNEPTSSQI